MRTLRYIAILLGAFVAGLVLALSANTETDAQLQEIDTFITVHTAKPVETEPETVSLSYEEWKHGNMETVINDNSAVYSNTINPVSGDVDILETVLAEETEGTRKRDMEAVMTVEDFQQAGVIDWNGWRYTYYSEQVLPGGGLDIPGRWSDGQFVRDENGYLCVASNEVPYGEMIETPFGTAIVYDSIGDGVVGIIDIYVSW